jgi:hypothetical protein
MGMIRFLASVLVPLAVTSTSLSQTIDRPESPPAPTKVLPPLITDCLNQPQPTKDLPPGLQFPTVCPRLPFDVTFGASTTPANDPSAVAFTQKPFDLFSWASFIALNWPADADGRPIGERIGDQENAPRIWETFISAPQVFKASGAPPDPWGDDSSVLRAMIPEARKGQRILVSPTKNVLADFLQPDLEGPRFRPITDLNGNYVFYETRLNKTMYNYINANTLYSKAGQSAFLQKPAPANAIDFPKGSNGSNLPSSPASVAIKAMWKQLGAGDDPDRFYTIQAIRVDPVSKKPSPKPIPFGLVGLHIVTRTASAPSWIWSTFEHNDNVPDAGELKLKYHYNFFDPKKPLPAGGFGFQPTNNVAVANPTIPTQIARVLNNNLINADWTIELNATMQTKLAGTVWANYRLVSTQWPSPVIGLFIPCRLTNTVAETYVQNDAFAGSCLRCHSVAKSAGTDRNGVKAPANFSYLLRQAR